MLPTIHQKGDGISLITGVDKEKNLQISMYNSCVNKFSHDMYVADEVFCIGYGCGDDHINSALRLFFLLNKPVKFVDFSDGTDVNNNKRKKDLLDGFLKRGCLGYQLDKVGFSFEGAKKFLEGQAQKWFFSSIHR